ncbi:MAG: AraC family transcriptional regulator [Cyclobacteriaceae bacterium]
MFYQIIKPSIPLQEYIKSYFIWEHCGSSANPFFEVHSAPNGYTGMVINYGNPYSIWGSTGIWQTTTQSFVAGQFTKKYKIGLNGNVGIIGVVFWPGAMERLLKIPTLEFTDQRIDLKLVLGENFRLLEEQILESHTNETRVGILNRFFSNYIEGSSNQPDLVDDALSKILNSKGILSIRDLSKNYCLSPRHFRRRFTDRVGVSPKMYSRIKRFNYISYLTIKEFENWQDLVYKGGFYDQAHFIRDFCHFTGKKPTDFVNYNRGLVELMGA